MRFERLRFGVGRLGLVARFVYVLWALLCLALYWLWMSGVELWQGKPYPATVEEAQARYERNLKRWEAKNPNRIPETVTLLDEARYRWRSTSIDPEKSAETAKTGVCVNFSEDRFICPQSYLDDRLATLSSEQGEARVSVRWRVLTLFAGGLLLFYPLIWGIAAILETKWYEDWFKESGGSARWGGVLAFNKYGWRWIRLNPKAPIYMGRTFHRQDPWPLCRKIGVDDENHMLTIAQSRSGKSVTVIWPNLVRYAYPDSVFVLDPKGEHAIMTGKYRAAMGQRVYVLDPFNETKGQVERHFFNPLAEIDPNSPRAKNDIQQIAEACVITAATSISEGGEHFRDLATTVIVGLIAHVLTTEPKEKHTLPEVYNYFMALRANPDSFLPQMQQNHACGEAPSEAVGAYLGTPDKNRGDIFTTMLNALKWVSSDGMREHLSRSDFTLDELRTHRTSLYVVLDFDDMKPRVQGRYMRVLFNLALRKSYITPLPQDRLKAGRRTLFILDEVGQLGYMANIQEAYRSHAGANVKLWCFFQDWEALTSTFSSSGAVLGNSTKQFFGCNDADTAEEIERYLGQKIYKDKAGREQLRGLLDHNEIMNKLGQHDPEQIVITGAKVKYKMLLKRETCIPSPDEEDLLLQRAEQHKIKRIRKLRLRMLPERAKINAARKLIDGVQTHLSNLEARYDREKPPAGYVMSQFKKVVEDSDVKAVLNKFPEAMMPEQYCLHHAAETNFVFCLAARILPSDEILEMADYISSNEVLRLSASVSAYGYWRDDIFRGFMELVKRCPVENKLELYAKLEASGYLGDRMPKRKSSHVAIFVTDAFEGIDTKTAIAVLRSSKAWKDVKKDKSLWDWLEGRGERLRPALEEEQEQEEAGEEAQRGGKHHGLYTDEQEAARVRWSLAVGYTEAQVHERAPFMYENAGAAGVDQITKEYNILLEAAA